FSIGVIGGLATLGVIHEAAHAVVIAALGPAPRAVYTQGLRVGLHRTRLTPGRDIAVSMSGPLAGTLVGAIAVAALLEIDRSAATTMSRAALVGLLIATSSQIVCLVPPAADGTMLMAALRRMRRRPTKEAVAQ
ncbi:MAG: hypothetical protein ACRCY9_10805, partial [Phycicoccus sp.]